MEPCHKPQQCRIYWLYTGKGGGKNGTAGENLSEKCSTADSGGLCAAGAGQRMNPMMAEKIKFVMIRRNMTTTALAQAINTSPANLSNKLRRDDFRESELREIAKALNCTFESNFVLNDSGAKF